MKKIIFGLLLVALSISMLSCSRRVDHTRGKFVFSAMRKQGSGQFLYRDGNLTFLGKDMVCSIWSPDGKRIATCASSQDSYEECKHIFIFDEYGNKLEVIDTPVGIGTLDWLPDGSGFVYVGYTSRVVNKFNPNLIYQYKFDDKKHTQIFKGDKDDTIHDVFCSPNGDRVIFVNYTDNGREGPYIMDINGDNLVHINKDAQGGSWFPDGKHICLYTYNDAEGNPVDPELESNAYFKYNLETGKYEFLVDGQGFTWGDKISRDGKYLYFARQERGGRVINVVPLFGRDKGKSFPIIPNGKVAYDGYPDWYQE